MKSGDAGEANEKNEDDPKFGHKWLPKYQWFLLWQLFMLFVFRQWADKIYKLLKETNGFKPSNQFLQLEELGSLSVTFSCDGMSIKDEMLKLWSEPNLFIVHFIWEQHWKIVFGHHTLSGVAKMSYRLDSCKMNTLHLEMWTFIGPRLIAGSPSGLLDFVLCALYVS